VTNPWTEADDRHLRKRHREGASAQEIADELGRARADVYGRGRWALGLSWSSRWSEAEDDTLRRLWEAGSPVSDIAVALRQTEPAVTRRAQRLGLPAREVRSIRRPWTDEEDAVIRRMWPKYQVQAIADELRRSVRSVAGRAHRIGVAGEDKTARKAARRRSAARAKGTVICGACGAEGHNRRACPMLEEA
jgi:hypothetical protein